MLPKYIITIYKSLIHFIIYLNNWFKEVKIINHKNACKSDDIKAFSQTANELRGNWLIAGDFCCLKFLSVIALCVVLYDWCDVEQGLFMDPWILVLNADRKMAAVVGVFFSAFVRSIEIKY